MTYRATKWKIHLGAHKTATTHIQDIAEQQYEKLHHQGIDYISRGNIRSHKVLAKPGRFHWREKFNSKPLVSAFHHRLKKLRRGGDTVVLSEENFLGNATALLSSNFYSKPSPYLKIIDSLSKNNEVSVFLSIRPQVNIIPSAYIQVLRTHQLNHGFERIKKEIIENPPSWVTLIRTLKESLPDVKLTVWTMEDYLRDKDAVLSLLFGTEFPHFEDIKAPSRTKSPSLEAIRKIELLPSDILIKEYRKRVTKIIQNDQGKIKFSPFTESELTILNDQYNSDLSTIQHEFPGMLFEI